MDITSEYVTINNAVNKISESLEKKGLSYYQLIFVPYYHPKFGWRVTNHHLDLDIIENYTEVFTTPEECQKYIERM